MQSEAERKYENRRELHLVTAAVADSWSKLSRNEREKKKKKELWEKGIDFPGDFFVMMMKNYVRMRTYQTRREETNVWSWKFK